MTTWEERIKGLTTEERDHLIESGVHDEESAQRNFNQLARWRREKPSLEPCWECKMIAKKLGFEF